MFFSTSLVLITSLFLPGNNKIAHAIDENNYSFSDNPLSIDSRDILEILTNNPNQFDYDYVSNIDYSISYNENPNKDEVITSIIDDTLYVYAPTYKAKGRNNKDVNWIPSTLSYNDESYDFAYELGRYKVTINNYDPTIEEVTINYVCPVEIDKDIASDIVNGAFKKGQNEANKQLNDIQSYNEALEAYNQYLLDLEAYNTNSLLWDNYDAAYETYQDYLTALEDYQNRYNLYLQNKQDWEEYNANYTKWIKYQTDLAYYNEHHEQNQMEYDNFYPNFMKFEYRLNAMGLAYKPMKYMNRVIYDQIMGDAVTQVLDRKADLVALGVSEVIVNKAYDSTLVLRRVLTEYKNALTDAEKYAYYYHNYTVIKANVETLLRCLDKLYRSALVPEAIASMGKDKTEKYLFLVAQLVYLANAISDKEVYNYEAWNGLSGNLDKPGAAIFNDTWTLKGKTWREYLEGEEIIDIDSETLKAYPAESNFPSEIVELIPEPEFVEEPTKPSVTLNEPIRPSTVNEPVEPSIRLERPEVVNNPIYSEYVEESIYADAYNNGLLIQREEYAENPTIFLRSNASINIESKLSKLVRFEDENGLLYESFFNTHPTYEGSKPYKEQDETFNDYLFVGWKDKNGQLVNLEDIFSSMKLEAAFEGRNLDKFDITFVIGNENIVISSPVGELPNPPSNVSLPETDEHFYVFIGWDKELEIVSRATTYAAIFDEKNKYVITWNIDGNSVEEIYKEGELPEYHGEVTKPSDDTDYYDFVSWDKELEIVSENTSYTAIFEQKPFVVITWNLGDTNEIRKYKLGETVNDNDINPVKQDDETYYYEFNSWSISLPFVAESNITINAIYDRYNYVYSTYYLSEETIIYKTKQNEIVPIPEVEDYFDECYYYSFSGFNLLAESSNNRHYYRPAFTKDYILKNNDTGVRISVESNVITIYLNEEPNKFDLSNLFALFDKGYDINYIKIIGKKSIIGIPKTQVRLLVNDNISKISLNMTDLGHKQYEYSVNLYDQQGTDISNVDVFTFLLDVDGNYDYLRSFAYLDGEKVSANIEERHIQINIKPGKTYKIYPVYKITVLESENVEIQLDKETAMFGEKITFSYTLNEGYECAGFHIIDTKGNICNISVEYIMQDSDISLGITLIKKKLNIKFYVDDVLIANVEVNYGDPIVAPTNVYKAPEGDIRYVFKNWDKELGNATENAEFHAVFEAVEIEKPNPDMKISVISIIKWGTVGVLVSGIGVAVFLILRKKVFKRH